MKASYFPARLLAARLLAALMLVPLTLTGCQSAQSSGTSERGQREVLPAIQHDYARGIAHNYSGTLFPPEVGGFSLTDHRVYDAAGRDFSAVYQLQETSGRIGVNIHVFPTGVTETSEDRQLNASRLRDLVQRELERSQAQLRQNHREVRLLDETQLVLPLAGQQRTVYRAMYVHQQTPLVLSQIYVTLLDQQWYLKYRVTSWGYEPEQTYERIGPLLAEAPEVRPLQ